MTNKGYRPKSSELYENYRVHYANRKKAQALGAAIHTLKPLADLEHEAWVAYVQAKRRETPRGKKFILPSRPL